MRDVFTRLIRAAWTAPQLAAAKSDIDQLEDDLTQTKLDRLAAETALSDQILQCGALS